MTTSAKVFLTSVVLLLAAGSLAAARSTENPCEDACSRAYFDCIAVIEPDYVACSNEYSACIGQCLVSAASETDDRGSAPTGGR